MIRALVPIGVITLVYNLGGGIIAPTLPLYARTLGADYRDLGLIGASHGLAFAVLTIPFGRASDRIGRRVVMIGSAVAILGAVGVYLLAGRVAGLALGKLLEAAGWAAFWPAIEAWIAERFGRHAGTAVGVAYGAYAAAYVVGSSAAGFVIEAAGLRAPFTVALVTSAIALVLVIALTRGAGAGHGATGHAAGATPAIVITQPAVARRQRLLAYATGFVYIYGLGSVLAFLPAYGTDRGLSPRDVGLLLGAYWIARVLGSLVAGRVSDLVGRRAVLVPATAVAAAGAALLIAPGGSGLLFLGAGILGLSAGASAPSCVGHIADHVSAADRGIAMGLFEAACGAAILVSGVVGGYAAAAVGGEAPYAIAGLLSLGWCVALARGLRPASAA